MGDDGAKISDLLASDLVAQDGDDDDQYKILSSFVFSWSGAGNNNWKLSFFGHIIFLISLSVVDSEETVGSFVLCLHLAGNI